MQDEVMRAFLEELLSGLEQTARALEILLEQYQVQTEEKLIKGEFYYE